jgi:ribosomal protein S18 acetylase RimI-like enzyme
MTCPDPAEPIHVHDASMSDADRLVGCLSAAYHHDPLMCWLMPDDQDRQRRLPRLFQVFVAHVLSCGEVHTTPEFDGVALWLDVGNDQHAASLDGADALRRALGPNHARFAVLDRLIGDTHPTGVRHAYLPFVGVKPEHQGRGIGRTLLAHKLSEPDTDRTPVYAEATSVRSLGLFERLGFRRLPLRIDLPRGPNLYP